MSDIETKRHDPQSTMVPIFLLTDWWLSDLMLRTQFSSGGNVRVHHANAQYRQAILRT